MKKAITNRPRLSKRSNFGVVALMGAALFVPALAHASTLYVDDFGIGGWESDDTRSATGADLVGTNDTHAGKPGQTPTTADDAAISTQIEFVTGPAGSKYGGAVSLDGTSSNSGKSSISVIDATGFAASSSLVTGFSASYQWYGQPDPTSRTLAFKIGIQSTDWGTGAGQSQNGFTATRSGESIWDLILVDQTSSSDNAWSTVNLDPTTGLWSLHAQSNNGFFTVPATSETLAQWAADPTWGPLLFGAGAEISSIQFGLGSGQRDSISYLDYLQTNLLNGGDAIAFATPVPEPATLSLFAVALIGLWGFEWRRRRQAS